MDLKKLFEVDLNQRLESDPQILEGIQSVLELCIDDKAWHLDLAHERRVKSGKHTQPDLRIEMSQDQLEKLIAGKLNIALALAMRRIKVSGQLSLLPRIKELFS